MDDRVFRTKLFADCGLLAKGPCKASGPPVPYAWPSDDNDTAVGNDAEFNFTPLEAANFIPTHAGSDDAKKVARLLWLFVGNAPSVTRPREFHALNREDLVTEK